jgi:hypothetical protein
MSNSKKAETQIWAIAQGAVAGNAMVGAAGAAMTAEDLITTASATLAGMSNPYASYTKEQWIEELKHCEKYPEAIEAMKVLSSKLNRSLK